MGYHIGVPLGIYGETTRYLCLLPRCRIGLRTQEKKSGRQISGEYLDWALENFSGYLAADEIYDGPFCILFIVDSIRRKRIAYEVLDRDPEKKDILAFFRKVDMILFSRGLITLGITTDGSPLYPEPIATVWPMATHQVCEFHILKEITLSVLRAIAKVRKSLLSQIPKINRGRPSTAAQKRKARRGKLLRAKLADLFNNRHLFVKHHLTPSEKKTLKRLAHSRSQLKALRELMDDIYALFDRRCRTDTALAKLAKLRSKLKRFKDLNKTLQKINSHNIEKALMFLDDSLLEATSNSVEVANRRHRKMQKTIYRVRTEESITNRIALDMLRDQECMVRQDVLALLHYTRN
jgi:Transposase